MTPSLDTDLLRAFVTVADLQSFTRAAGLLHVTQSGISLQIRRLEEALETRLLDRGPRGIRLTAAGEAFLVYARRILTLHEEAAQRVRRSDATGQLRLGIPDVYAIRYLPPLLQRFRERFPDVRPEIFCAVSTRIVERFEQGELDVCLTVKHGGGAGGDVLGDEPIHWVCSAHLQPGPDEPVPLAVYPEPCVYREQGLRALAQIGRSWRIVYTSQSSRAIDLAVDTGFAVSIRSRSTLDPGWRILGEPQGMPPLHPVQLELRRAPTTQAAPLKEFCELLEHHVRHDLESAPDGSFC